MYAILHKQDNRHWISGIFQERDKASEYVDDIPTYLNPRLIEFEIDCYPVYVLEIKDEDFVFIKTWISINTSKV